MARDKITSYTIEFTTVLAPAIPTGAAESTGYRIYANGVCVGHSEPIALPEQPGEDPVLQAAIEHYAQRSPLLGRLNDRKAQEPQPDVRPAASKCVRFFPPGSFVALDDHDDELIPNRYRVQSVTLNRTGLPVYYICGRWISHRRIEAIPGQPIAEITIPVSS